ncbi:MAG: hypothetical protein QHH02_01375 [Syntrophomonadaceae bacterium]|nr:hypothetical protein [Syntrophomonadaceae bacterium]
MDTYVIVLDRDRRYRGQEVLGLDQVSREPCFELIDMGKLDSTCEHLFLNQFRGKTAHGTLLK